MLAPDCAFCDLAQQTPGCWKRTILLGNDAVIACRGVWKIFGADAARVLEEFDGTLSKQEIQVRTRHVVAVKDVSFEVRKGECFVVMGLSGSGKSTLVRCLSRLIEPTAGEVLIGGDDVTAMSRRDLLELRRHKLAMVFQHFGLFPHRTVIDNISYGLEIRGIQKEQRLERAREMLELVGLHGWDQCYPRELSGGMQQRVGLARAMAVNPEILIFDEPFSALDPLIRREMQDELIELQNRLQKTMVFITHDFLEAIKMGDHIAIMKDGEVSQIGTPEEIVADPVDDYVRDFTEDVPRYKVLSAGKVMRALNHGGIEGGAAPVLTTAKIDSLISRVADDDNPVPVATPEGKLVGEIDRSIVMRAMQSRD